MWVTIVVLGTFALITSSVLKFAERWATEPWTRGSSRWTNARLGMPWLSRP
jgi:hypothetical protein